MMTIGIDIGISTTKIVTIKDGTIIAPERINSEATPNVLSHYLHTNGIEASDVEHVALTGVGASRIREKISDLPTLNVSEFDADGLGAHYLSNLDKMMVVSMGSGTTILEFNADETKHVGGIAMGGGTLVGLSRLLLGTDDVAYVSEMAQRGAISNIDMQIGDICEEEIPGLPAYATASLFGKTTATASREDTAAGIINMVVQTIGSATVLAARNTDIRDFAMIGTLTLLPQCREVFDMMEQLYGVRFHIPNHAEFATAIGAAIMPHPES